MRRILLFIFMVLMTSSTLIAQEKIKFEVSFKEPQAHYVEVLMRISNIKDDVLDLRMPVWAPGSYLIREFPKNVEAFGVTANGKAVKSEKVNKNTWRVDTKGESSVEVAYRVYAYEVSVRTSFIDASHAFLSPTGIFMFIDKKLDLPAEVQVHPHADWTSISTGLPSVEGRSNTYYSENFDVLFDSPIEVGNQDIFYFEAAGVDHEVAMVGGGNYDKERLKKDMASIVEAETRVYGENPNEKYVFIVHNYRAGGGGLEHINSTTLGASRFAYATERGYKGFLGLVAHEYFHLWNVKRLRPEHLGPFDYSNENYTPNLWISEGFTAYYDNHMLRRCGFYGVEEYLNILGNEISSIENRPGNLVQSLSSSSFDAWIKQYRPDENSYNTSVTYYTKGAIIAMLLDLRILEATKGAKRLDDVMKAMYNTYYLDKNTGFTREQFEAMANQVAGISLEDVFANVDVAAPIDYNRYLNYAGLELVDLNEDKQIKTLDVRLSEREGKIMVNAVYRGGSAWDGGLNVGDELIAIDGYRVQDYRGDVERALDATDVGSTLEVTIARDGKIMQLPLEVRADKQKDYHILALDNPSAGQLEIRKQWLEE